MIHAKRPYRRLLALSVLACCGVTWSQPVLNLDAAVQTATQTPPRPREQGSLPGSVPSALPNEPGSVKFLVIGDSGTGGRSQYQVAERIVQARARFPFGFALMLGDNMYGGENPSDFVSKFERPYKPLLDAGITFHASLGNHDDPAQRLYKPFNMGGDRYYAFRKGPVEFFALDSTYMTPDQVRWVDNALGRSNADWKIAYMHHPLYSSGEKHGSDTSLRTLLEPIFLRHGVNVVLAGHEHFYERLKPQKGIYYFIQGGAAKLRAGNIGARSPLTDKGFDTDNSFTLMEVSKDRLFFETLSRAGRVVDSGVILQRPDTRD
jgi:hypothetical protein